jgi:hypothetical protein
MNGAYGEVNGGKHEDRAGQVRLTLVRHANDDRHEGEEQSGEESRTVQLIRAATVRERAIELSIVDCRLSIERMGRCRHASRDGVHEDYAE